MTLLSERYRMNIIVCIKQVPESHCQIIPTENGQSIEEQDIYWTLSPEDECVVEQALQICEKVPGSTVTAIRVGSKEKQEALISALAMGVNKAILVTSNEVLDPFRIAKALASVIKSQCEDPDLILCGNISYDNQNQQVPQLLAQMIDLPAITRVIEISMDDQAAKINRQGDGGNIEVYKTSEPILLACSYGIVEPRYAPLPHIKRAEKEVIVEMSLKEVGVKKNDQRLRYKNFRPMPIRKAGKVFKFANDEEDVLLNEVVDVLLKEVRSFQD